MNRGPERYQKFFIPYAKSSFNSIYPFPNSNTNYLASTMNPINEPNFIEVYSLWMMICLLTQPWKQAYQPDYQVNQPDYQVYQPNFANRLPDEMRDSYPSHSWISEPTDFNFEANNVLLLARLWL